MKDLEQRVVRLQQWYQESTDRNHGNLLTQEQALEKEFQLKKDQTLPPATTARIDAIEDGTAMLEINERFYNFDKRLREVEELCSLLRTDFFSSVTDVDRACT